MGRLYSATFENIAQTTTGDILEITAPADKIVMVHSIFYGQHSDPGDAEAEMGRVTLRRATTSGSGGTTINANPFDPGDSADSSTIERHNGTPASGLDLLIAEAFNWQAGWFYRPAPMERIILGGQDILVMRLETTPADELSTSATLLFEEIG